MTYGSARAEERGVRRVSPPPSRHDENAETGVVKWFNEEKAYGFIVPDAGGVDIFVHVKRLIGMNTLREGERVSFVRERAPDGRLRAANVRLA